MTIIAVILAVSLVVVVALMLAHYQRAERAWAGERRELLNRVQRPEMVVSQAGEPFAFPDQEDDELNLIGSIKDPPLEEAE